MNYLIAIHIAKGHNNRVPAIWKHQITPFSAPCPRPPLLLFFFVTVTLAISHQSLVFLVPITCCQARSKNYNQLSTTIS